MIGVGMTNIATARQLSDTLREFGNNRSVHPSDVLLTPAQLS
jgi:hypothetical protein